MGHSSNNSETALFRPEELFSALHHSVLVVRVMAAHDKGSHAEVEVKIKKVIYYNPELKHLSGRATLYPESWTIQGCTCPILNPGSDYLVAGHEDWRTGRLLINTKSFVKPWKISMGRKILHILRKDCGQG